MPGLVEPGDDLAAAVHQIILSSSETDYLDQLIPVLRDGHQADRASQLVHSLHQVASRGEAEIEQICNSNHQDFLGSVDRLQLLRQHAAELGADVSDVSEAVQASMRSLAEQKRALVNSRSVRQNIDDASQALKDCLEVLRLANQVHDLLAKKNHYAALRALDELENVHLRELTRYKIAEMIEKSVPATQKLIAEAVMTDLRTWLYRIRETSQFLGEVAFFQTEERRRRQKERMAKDPYLARFRLNSAIERVADESEEFDVLNNENIQVDFSPLLEALHIHEALGQTDRFRAEYAATRRRQKELLLPPSIKLEQDEEGSLPDLSGLLESIAGFGVVEKATLKKTEALRAAVDVDDLWDSMCQNAITLISAALHSVTDAEVVLKVKGVIALLVQTMVDWDYSLVALDSFLLTLFDKYAQLLKRRFSQDFQEIVSTDDYMPMSVDTLEDYDKIVQVSWYKPDKDRQNLTFPLALPFSQMYPLCCMDIRNFIDRFSFFSDDHFQHPNIIDTTLKDSLDELLREKVCKSLIERLSSQYPGQIVQIFTNLQFFETACLELENLLAKSRSASAVGGPVALSAVEAFREGKKTAEKRIFELVNSKIDDLIEIAEYDWEMATPQTETSSYIVELTRYLSNIITSVLLALPDEIKELIYLSALSHAAEAILGLPLDPNVKRVSPPAVALLATDTAYLVRFVESLQNPILLSNLNELVQTVALMNTDNPDEFYDVSMRNRKYGAVDPLNGAVLLEKVGEGKASMPTSVPQHQQQHQPDRTGAQGTHNLQSRGEKFASSMGRRLGALREGRGERG